MRSSSPTHNADARASRGPNWTVGWSTLRRFLLWTMARVHRVRIVMGDADADAARAHSEFSVLGESRKVPQI